MLRYRNETKISRYRVVFFKDRNIAGYFSSLSVKDFTGTVLWIGIETNGSALKPMDPYGKQWIRTEIRIETNGSALVSMRIRIQDFLVQIRIQHFVRIRIKGFDDQELVKIYSCQKNFHLIKSGN